MRRLCRRSRLIDPMLLEAGQLLICSTPATHAAHQKHDPFIQTFECTQTGPSLDVQISVRIHRMAAIAAGKDGAGQLFRLWEADSGIRERLRSEKCLLTWPKPELVGVPCLTAVGQNWRPLVVLANFHCKGNDKIKPPSVQFLKKQAGETDNKETAQKTVSEVAHVATDPWSR